MEQCRQSHARFENQIETTRAHGRLLPYDSAVVIARLVGCTHGGRRRRRPRLCSCGCAQRVQVELRVRVVATGPGTAPGTGCLHLCDLVHIGECRVVGVGESVVLTARDSYSGDRSRHFHRFDLLGDECAF